MKRAALATVAFALVAAGCGKDANDAAPAAAAPALAPATAPSSPAVSPTGSASTPASPQPLAGRTGELAQPDELAIVLLYHDLAGLPVPVADWVERDTRVQFAPGAQKAGLREQITREVEAAQAAVKSVGTLLVTLADAQLSDYDPGYGEFTIRALAPSSTIPFKAQGTEVAIKFDNAREVQLLKMDAAEAQRLTDTLGRFSRGTIDLELAITGVVPGTAGGTLTTRVVGYTLRTQQGQTLVRKRFDS